MIGAMIKTAFALLATALAAAPATAIDDRVTPAFLDEFRAFLALPNDARNAADMAANVRWLEAAFSRRGFAVKDLSDEGYSLMFAERRVEGAERTLLLYFHYDGQPVDPSRWQQADPYRAVLKVRKESGWTALPWPTGRDRLDPEWRVFARSASDDKGPIVMLLHALDRLAEQGTNLGSNIKVILDGQEERGSPGLALKIARVKDLLAADYLLVLDGPVHFSNRPTLNFGCRGLARLTLTTYGPAQPEHSGHFGNVAPNPAFRLGRLLAALKDPQGQVLVQGFYDDVVITPEERAMIDGAPDDREALRVRLQVPALETVGKSYHEALQYPSFNVRQMQSPTFAGSRTIVPDQARAQIDIRLVPETSGPALIRRVTEHIQSLGYYVVNGEPTREERMKHADIVSVVGASGVPAFQTPSDSPIGEFLLEALSDAFGEPPIALPLMGGTVPITPFIKLLGFPAVIVPVVNSDNNQHSPNENIRLGNVAQGIQTLEAILTR